MHLPSLMERPASRQASLNEDGGDNLEVEDAGQGEAEIVSTSTSDAELAKVRQLGAHVQEGVDGEHEAVAREGIALDDSTENEEEGEDQGASEPIGSDLRVDADDGVSEACGEAVHPKDEEEPVTRGWPKGRRRRSR